VDRADEIQTLDDVRVWGNGLRGDTSRTGACSAFSRLQNLQKKAGASADSLENATAPAGCSGF
jgi:hypothetical protein